MPNNFAYIVLLVWPLVAMRIYQITSIQIASFWTFIGGLMLLPANMTINIPVLPDLDKLSVSSIAAVIGCVFIKKVDFLYSKKLGKEKYAFFALLIGPLITWYLNTDPIVWPVFMPGLNYRDAFGDTYMNLIKVIVPFFIGRQVFQTYDDQLLIFKLLVVAGLCYSLPVLFEIRMSPQLNNWVYGYSPSAFGQQIRDGGYRAVVFMGHGLVVAFFLSFCVIASVALWKNKTKSWKFPPMMACVYLLIVLVLSKSLGPLLYAMFSLFSIIILSYRVQYLFAIIFAFTLFMYPVMSMVGIFPHQKIVDIATSYSAERAESLAFRFDNEKILLERAKKHLYFGWGGWGRGRIMNSYGRDISVTDGKWIIELGIYGLMGFFSKFALLLIAVFGASSASRFIKSKPEQTLLAAHALMVGIISIDQIPNASLAPWFWLLAGALLGRSQYIINNRANS